MGDILNKYFQNLQGIFDEVLKLKNSSSDNAAELTEMRKRGALQFVVLKKINRQVKYDLRAGRDELHRVKQQVDSNQLQLQNLLYEVTHLKREIKKCHKFKSQDEDIELLPEEDYCAIIKTVKIPITEHEKRLARLEWELDLRKKLAAECKSMMSQKSELYKNIITQMDRLTSFGPSLAELLKATQPLQNALQMPLEREWRINQVVQTLPQPLYLAYMNIHGLEKSYEDDEIRVYVIGSEEDTVRTDDIEMLPAIEEAAPRSSDELDEGVEVITKKRRHTEHTDLTAILRKRALEPHSLIVRIVFKTTVHGHTNEFIVQMRYFSVLGLVTATSSFTVGDPDANTTADVTLLQDLLRIIYPNDEGNILPVPEAEHALNKLDMSGEECLEYFRSKHYGRPYRWLQGICGLEAYCPREFMQEEEKLVGMARTEYTIERLQYIWSARLDLMYEIKALMAKNIELYLKKEKLPTVRPACTLVQWTSISWEEYAADATTKLLIKYNLSVASHLYYRAVIVRGSAKMECLINVPHLYPTQNSLWAVCIYWNGERHAQNDANIKLLESYVNGLELTMLKDDKSSLVAAQLMRVMHSFDIYLETESVLYSPVEFPKEKHYVRVASLRMREKPLKFDDTSDENLFRQIH